MARFTPVDNTSSPSFKQGATPEKYIDLGAYINEIDQPDNREQLVKTYGDQLIGGAIAFTRLVGASNNVGHADEVTYWEEARLMKTQNGTMAATAAADTGAKLITTAAAHTIVTGDVVMINGYIRARATVNNATSYNVVPYAAAWGVVIAGNAFVKVHKIGNEFAQGTDQPVEYELSNIVKRTQPFIITKMTYSATGSAMGNIGWVKDEETGSLYWFQKGLSDQRKRYENMNEAMALFGQTAANTNLTGAKLNGAEGYVSAIENRGTVQTGYITDKTDLQSLSVVLDKQGAPSDYLWGMNRNQANYADNFIGNAMGQQPYGTFSNSAEMDEKLGFKNFNVGGRNFHCKVLPVLTDPTFAGQTDFYKYFMTPMGSVADPKTGIQAPSLEFNYKTYGGGAKRYMEHWLQGGVDGTYTNGLDKRSFEFRSEFNLITRGANRHVVGRGE
jgi:hypothetical protein